MTKTYYLERFKYNLTEGFFVKADSLREARQLAVKLLKSDKIEFLQLADKDCIESNKDFATYLN